MNLKLLLSAGIVALCCLVPVKAWAEPADSARWFGSLSETERATIQIGLVWTGHYNGFVDARYGGRFHRAVIAYQRQIGAAQTGILNGTQIYRLREAAVAKADAVGFQILQDEVTGIKLGVPTRLVQTAYAKRTGYSWQASNDSFSIETLRIDATEQSYNDLFKRFSTPSEARKVGYARDKGNFFVASGTYKGKGFYARFDRSPEASLGYVVSWDHKKLVGIDHVIIAIANSFSFDAYFRPGQPRVARAEPPEKPRADPPAPSRGGASSGTAFFVDTEGRFVTNEHVVRNCVSIEVVSRGPADIIRADAVNDIALLKLRSRPADIGVAKFRITPVQLAEPIAVLGFPYSDILGGLNVTLGSVSSLSGIGGDLRHFQLTAAVQPGNSGGPVIDASGYIAGMIQARLDDLATLAKTETLPQSVNFAIRYGLVMAVLEAEGVAVTTDALRGPVTDIPPAVGPAAVQSAAKFTARVVCSR